jgi:hypothetical protein
MTNCTKFDHFWTNFQRPFSFHIGKPSKNQAIDESMIRFKGRSSLRQYMRLKPIKRGYKVWIRAGESGYVNQFQIYVGKVGNDVEKNFGARVVKDLTRNIVGKGYNLYFHNLFNSVGPQKDLQDDVIYACGTFRKGRNDMPKNLNDDKIMERGDSDWRVLTFLKWKDRKAVFFLNNFHDLNIEETISRKNKDRSQTEIACPLIVKDYNRNMAFVDKMDMLKSLYEIDPKSKKWWHRILFHFIDVALVNSFIIYKDRSSEKIESLEHFRLSVMIGLIGAAPNKTRKGRPSNDTPVNNFKVTVGYEIRFDNCAHLPVHGNSRRCAFCSTRKEHHRTVWTCTLCQVGLCLSKKKNCFAKFHTK